MSGLSVLSVDPGGTTGWALWQQPPHGASLQTVELAKRGLHSYGQLEGGVLEQVSGLWDLFADYLAVGDIIVLEDFQLRPGMRKGAEVLHPVRIAWCLVGMLFDGGYVREDGGEGDITILWQSASSGKSVMTDARLKKADLWMRGMPHARDAIRHLVVALRTARKEEWI